MEQFPHLKFVQKITGKPRFPRRGEGDETLSDQNRNDRTGHSGKLQKWITDNKKVWKESIDQRIEKNLVPIDENLVPVFIQIYPDIINSEFELSLFGIEIISEEENGFIIGASLDNLKSLEDKIQEFVIAKRGSGRIADLWQIVIGNREDWKPKHILSPSLLSKWNEIDDNVTYLVEVSIAFDKPLRKAPNSNPTTTRGRNDLEKYNQELRQRDDLLMERENHFDSFIRYYGEITSSLIYLEDSFGCEVSISGKGLKDLVVTYPFVFEVSEVESVSGIDGIGNDYSDFDLEILAPDDGAVEIGIIDSGIMESHKYIEQAIISENSRSYLEFDPTTVDQVSGGGHGTRVAGAVLFPRGVSGITSPYKLPCFVRNLRILDADGYLTHSYPASLIESIVNDNEDCNVFNLSVCSVSPFNHKHMSSWAAIIDKLSFEKDLLFIISVGNIKAPIISQYLANGQDYPYYLNDDYCRLANPSQSVFSISVGSINHSDFEDDNWVSLGKKNEISSFSRKGSGIWGSIKPDVVQYGGGLVRSKNQPYLVTEHQSTSTELIRSTSTGLAAYGKDSVGTSYSAPKVTHIIALLKNLYPDENNILIRAFIAQGARLPNSFFFSPNSDAIKQFGYGVPSLDRVTKNTDHRITFYNTGEISAEEAHIYSLQIPKVLSNPGSEYEILLEVTLAYTAQVRRTRQKIKSYLSTWLDWTVSKIGEPFDEFKDYALKEIGDRSTTYDKETRKGYVNFDWKIKNFIGDRSGNVNEFNRNNSTLQKDWTIIRSYDLPDEISFAVRGHKGWDKNKNEVPYAITVSIEILGADIPIYEAIRSENQVEIESRV